MSVEVTNARRARERRGGAAFVCKSDTATETGSLCFARLEQSTHAAARTLARASRLSARDLVRPIRTQSAEPTAYLRHVAKTTCLHPCGASLFMPWSNA